MLKKIDFLKKSIMGFEIIKLFNFVLGYENRIKFYVIKRRIIEI